MSARPPEPEHRPRRRLGLGVGVLLAGALIALNAYDAATTLYVLKLGGEELNPIMGGLLAVSPWAFLAYKTVVICCCVTGLLAKWENKIARWGMVGLVAAYALLAVWNTLQVIL